MLPKLFAAALSFEIAFVINVVLGVLWIPVRVAELILLQKVLLWSPESLVAVRVFLRWERSHIFWDVHLILSHHVVESRVHLVLEEGVWYTEIVVRMDSNWQLSRNRIPRVFVHLPDRGVSEHHHCHLIISGRWPKDFYLLALRIGYYLSGEVSLVSFVKNINTVVDDDVSEINFFIRGQSKLLNS